MNKSFIVVLILVIPVLIMVSCSKSGGDNNSGGLNCSTVTNKSYAVDVNPIIQSSCNQVSCHASGSVNGPGALTNHAQVAAARATVRSAIAAGTMPQNSTLSSAQKNSILCWIDSGAPNN